MVLCNGLTIDGAIFPLCCEKSELRVDFPRKKTKKLIKNDYHSNPRFNTLMH